MPPPDKNGGSPENNDGISHEIPDQRLPSFDFAHLVATVAERLTAHMREEH